MARFRYRMQSILDIKLKMETQAKQNFANARNALDEELQRLETLKKRKAEYEERGRELLEGTLNLKDISENKHAILRMDEFIFTQKGAAKRAEAKLEAARQQLEEVMKEHNLPADLMCMILRDASSYFERKRANDYTNAIIQQTAVIEELKKENEALKKASQIFNEVEGSNDNTNT